MNSISEQFAILRNYMLHDKITAFLKLFATRTPQLEMAQSASGSDRHHKDEVRAPVRLTNSGVYFRTEGI